MACVVLSRGARVASPRRAYRARMEAVLASIAFFSHSSGVGTAGRARTKGSYHGAGAAPPAGLGGRWESWPLRASRSPQMSGGSRAILVVALLTTVSASGCGRKATEADCDFIV